MNSEQTGRHFTVAVFVVCEGKVLLHLHRKLGMWPPPGGHIEKGELPDEAAAREVFEETGVKIELVGERREDVDINSVAWPGKSHKMSCRKGYFSNQTRFILRSCS